MDSGKDGSKEWYELGTESLITCLLQVSIL